LTEFSNEGDEEYLSSAREAAPTVSITLYTIDGNVDAERIWGEFQVHAIVSLDTVYAEFIIDGEMKETYSSQHMLGVLWFNFKTADYLTGEHVIEVKAYDALGGMACRNILSCMPLQ
jgi:hypothetical protein